MKEIGHNLPTIGKSEIKSAKRVIKSNWLSQAFEVKAFESEVAAYLGLEPGEVVAVSSGSAALYVALRVIEVGSEEVVIPNYTCGAVRNALEMNNAKPVYLDSEIDSPNSKYRVDNTRERITIAVSNFGLPATIDSPGSKIIEDFSQSFGASIGGQKLGTRTFAGVCSTSTTKIFTTGGAGGLIVSRDWGYLESIRNFLNFDQRSTATHFNFQMTDYSAAFGRAQLKNINTFLEKREEIWEIYKNANLPLVDNLTSESSPVRYRAVLKTDQPDKMINFLNEKNIKGIVPYKINELGMNSSEYSNSIKFSQSSVSIPIYPRLRLADAKRIAKTLREFLKL